MGSPATTRKPRGYVGRNHEILGSDVLAALRVAKLPEHVLGPALASKTSEIKPHDWYPIQYLLDVVEALDRSSGYYGLLRVGRAVFNESHKGRMVTAIRSARDVLYGLDGMYHFANRGHDIGGWRVLKFGPGYAEIEKTTPQHCIMEQGIVMEALSTVPCPAIVAQLSCFRQGAESCVFTVTSSQTDERWSGQH